MERTKKFRPLSFIFFMICTFLIQSCALHILEYGKNINILANNSSHPISISCCFYDENGNFIVEGDYEFVGTFKYQVPDTFITKVKLTLPFSTPKIDYITETFDISKIVDNAITEKKGDALVNLSFYQVEERSKQGRRKYLEIIGDIIKIKRR